MAHLQANRKKVVAKVKKEIKKKAPAIKKTLWAKIKAWVDKKIEESAEYQMMEY